MTVHIQQQMEREEKEPYGHAGEFNFMIFHLSQILPNLNFTLGETTLLYWTKSKIFGFYACLSLRPVARKSCDAI